MESTRVRVRLKFQESDTLTSQQTEQGLAQSWYLVLLEEVHTIADVAFDIRAAFHLEESCPNGLSLEVEGFVLPDSQPACLLKDSDLIRIKRRTDIQDQLSHETKNKHDYMLNKEWYANGLQNLGYHGVELRALDEFEKETGGYESEQEEGEMETDVSLDGGLRPSKETSPSFTRKKQNNRSGKTRKRSGNVASEVGKVRRTKDLGAGQDLAIVPAKDNSNPVINSGVSRSLRIKPAMDEFEKESGKNTTEENGAVTAIFGKGKRSCKKVGADSQSTLSKQERIEKKRKRKELNMEGQRQLPQIGEERPSGSDMPQTVEHGKDGEQKVKRKKLDHSGAHPGAANVPSTETMDQVQVRIVDASCGLKKGITCSGKKNKRKDINGLNNENDVRKGKLKKATAVDKVGGKKRRKEAKLESPSEKRRTTEIKAMEGSIPARTPESKVNGESTIARTPKNETNAPIQEQRPSRSARRKKAKRQWLREQTKMALLTGVETRVSESKGSKSEVVQRELVTSPICDEIVELEAEEEVLPIVVRAGHIRFEPYDIGETQDQSGPSMVKTKRQGQNWGQERSIEKHKGKRLSTEADVFESPEELGDKRLNTRSDNQIDAVSFEKHPALHGAPQEGDVLAYRLVELTASWTPEISPYRVGVVAQWEHATNMIKVDPHPDYQRLGKKASSEDEEELWNVEEMEVVGPYDENGVLETEFSSLVEVRLMQRVPSEDHERGPCTSVGIGNELDPTTAGGHQSDNPPFEPVTDVGESIPTGEQRGMEDGERAECASTLHALLSDDLERKKTELCQRNVVLTNASIGLMAPSEQPKNVTVGSDGGKLLNQPKAGRDRKHKFLKSAGVGSIVALLRAQQAL